MNGACSLGEAAAEWPVWIQMRRGVLQRAGVFAVSQRSTCDTEEQSTREYSVDSAISEHARFPPPWSLRSEPTPTPTLLAMCAACPCDAKDGAAPDAAGHGGRNGRGGNATGEAREGGAHVYRTYNNTLIR